jgi:hypothetical protein
MVYCVYFHVSFSPVIFVKIRIMQNIIIAWRIRAMASVVQEKLNIRMAIDPKISIVSVYTGITRGLSAGGMLAVILFQNSFVSSFGLFIFPLLVSGIP